MLEDRKVQVYVFTEAVLKQQSEHSQRPSEVGCAMGREFHSTAPSLIYSAVTLLYFVFAYRLLLLPHS